jgi:hypothetical protein
VPLAQRRAPGALPAARGLGDDDARNNALVYRDDDLTDAPIPVTRP